MTLFYFLVLSHLYLWMMIGYLFIWHHIPRGSKTINLKGKDIPPLTADLTWLKGSARPPKFKNTKMTDGEFVTLQMRRIRFTQLVRPPHKKRCCCCKEKLSITIRIIWNAFMHRTIYYEWVIMAEWASFECHWKCGLVKSEMKRLQRYYIVL